jgi:hypothetical protein
VCPFCARANSLARVLLEIHTTLIRKHKEKIRNANEGSAGAQRESHGLRKNAAVCCNANLPPEKN